mgnify:CR=1 FL=1
MQKESKDYRPNKNLRDHKEYKSSRYENDKRIGICICKFYINGNNSTREEEFV